MACLCLQLNSIRKQIKPVSGNVGLRKKQEEESSRQRQQHSSHNGPSSHDDVRRRGASALRSPQRDPNQKPPVSSHKSPAVTRNAKKKWEMLERKVCRLDQSIFIYICILYCLDWRSITAKLLFESMYSSCRSILILIDLVGWASNFPKLKNKLRTNRGWKFQDQYKNCTK